MTKKEISEVMRAMGRRGGKARAAKLTPEELSAQGKKASQARKVMKKREDKDA
jgi:hypothetical protein